jgi:DNA-binding XRE family transcriptional regulator
MSSTTIYVYALAAPGSKEPKYIGRAKNPLDRANGHSSRSAAKRVREWVASVGKPDVLILRECGTEPEAQAAERAEIAAARLRGAQLLNSTAGGESARARRDIPPGGMGLRIKQLREKLGVSAAELGRMCGICQPSLSRVENEHRAFSAWSAVKLARALGTMVEWLVTGEGEENAKPEAS